MSIVTIIQDPALIRPCGWPQAFVLAVFIVVLGVVAWKFIDSLGG